MNVCTRIQCKTNRDSSLIPVFPYLIYDLQRIGFHQNEIGQTAHHHGVQTQCFTFHDLYEF